MPFETGLNTLPIEQKVDYHRLILKVHATRFEKRYSDTSLLFQLNKNVNVAFVVRTCRVGTQVFRLTIFHFYFATSSTSSKLIYWSDRFNARDVWSNLYAEEHSV